MAALEISASGDEFEDEMKEFQTKVKSRIGERRPVASRLGERLPVDSLKTTERRRKRQLASRQLQNAREDNNEWREQAEKWRKREGIARLELHSARVEIGRLKAELTKTKEELDASKANPFKTGVRNDRLLRDNFSLLHRVDEAELRARAKSDSREKPSMLDAWITEVRGWLAAKRGFDASSMLDIEETWRALLRCLGTAPPTVGPHM